MNRILSVTLLLLFPFINRVMAQEDSLRLQKVINAATVPPYKLAVGVRGLNLVGEYDLGLTAKYFVSIQSALEAGVSKVIANNNAYQLSLMYERHNRMFKSRNLLIYYGAGGGIFLLNSKSWLEPPGSGTLIRGGIGFIAGVEIGLGKLPLAVSADFRGLYYPTEPNHRGDGGKMNVASPAFGIKYRFGLQK
ncbi:hypothetical protein FVR03_00610 [Pontibacter qinzhouensis]|uniref:DUF3575 domain-containing protein n=1 Tax=Pontibacter qinzhouensis TaxID=2603253 RepID=A0A5C8KEC6_9BACT|nr:hypothetical protein [Pontibacter qinzhouensis]TXK52908.1 hypothetical protein FVR03_00610 [Pontibacter qinzhouensis]